LSLSPLIVAVAVVPRATAGLEPVAVFVNAVPTGSTSTSRRTWSPGSGSSTTAVNRAVASSVVPPIAIAVVPSERTWPSEPGVSGACGTATWKSAALSALPPNEVQALARPVRSTARACQW